RAARLVGDCYAAAAFADRVAENCGLRCLAASLDAFERDEYAGCHRLLTGRRASLAAKIPVRELRLKERKDAGGQREVRAERNFGAQNRDVGFLRIRRGLAERGRRSGTAAGERQRDPADRADYRTEKHREERARPAEKSAYHPEQPHVTQADAFAPADQLIEIAGAEQDAAAHDDSNQRALPADLRHHQRRGDESRNRPRPRNDVRNQPPVVVYDRDDPQRRAQHQARDRLGERKGEAEIESGDGESEFGQEMAERNRRAAHHASPAESKVGENRDVRPPRNRTLATLAIRARRDDRKIARQPVGNRAAETAEA